MLTIPKIHHVLRTDENFREQIDNGHRSGDSQLLQLEKFNMACGFPLDYVRTAFLKGKRIVINRNVELITKCLPKEFGRPLEELG